MSLIRNLGRNTPVALRLGIAIALPIVVMAALAAVMIGDQWQISNRMDQLRTSMRFAIRLGDLVHELQKERGMSAVFLNSGGRQLAAELPGQRLATTERLTAAQAVSHDMVLARYPADMRQTFETGLAALGELAGRREEISAKRIAGTDSNKFFTDLIGKMLTVARDVVKISDDPAATISLMAYHSYLSAKERAGQERATAALAFSAGQFAAAQHSIYRGVVAEQMFFFEAFDAYAKPEQRAFARQTVSGPIAEDVERMRRIALEAGVGTPLVGVTGTEWYKATTARIDLMKRVENRLTGDLTDYAGQTSADIRRWLIATIMLSLATLVGSVALGVWLSLGITRPIAGMTSAMLALAGGDLSREIPARGNKDEFGRMAGAVQVFKESGVENARLIEAEKAELLVKAQRQAAVAGLIANFEREVTGALNALASSSTELNATATSMAGTAEETTRQATGVAAASEQATMNVQTVAAATEELAASVGEIGRQVAQSAKIASQAVTEAEATTTAMRGLAAMAQSVDTVVKIISEIAGQTNLLALNATIEAARAGDAGKGFAVVASEVKALANRTAKATEEIGQQINAIQAATGASMSRIEVIGTTIAEMSQIAATIAAAVEEQGAATQEIARNVQEAAMGTGQVSAAITGVSQAAGETGAAASQVQAASGEVAQQGQTLKREVDRFLTGIRAA